MLRFKYELKDFVKIDVSGEEGVIIGRAEYTYCENAYFIRLKAADGRAVEAWWSEEAISKIQ